MMIQKLKVKLKNKKKDEFIKNLENKIIEIKQNNENKFKEISDENEKLKKNILITESYLEKFMETNKNVFFIFILIKKKKR
jgi:hypothetical protein